jgi:hypothetical protein
MSDIGDTIRPVLEAHGRMPVSRLTSKPDDDL